MKQKQPNLKIAMFVIGFFLFITLLNIPSSECSSPEEIISLTTSGDFSSQYTYLSLNEPNVAVDSEGNWHIVYFKRTDTPSTGKDELQYFSNKISLPATIDSVTRTGPGAQFWSPSIAVDAEDNVHIMYEQSTHSYIGRQYNDVYSIMYASLQLIPKIPLGGSKEVTGAAGPEVLSHLHSYTLGRHVNDNHR